MISREVILAFPDFSQPFEIYTDASNLQQGAVIAQNKKPIAFFSHKLNLMQRLYTTKERELQNLVTKYWCILIIKILLIPTSTLFV